MSPAKNSTIDAVWERIRGGRHAALVGMEPPAIPDDLRAIRIRCDAPPSTFGPLLEARRGIEAVLGDEVPLVAQARERVFSGLRRHLFGDLPQTGADAVLVEVANRLAQHSEHPAVLVFEAVEEADEATLASLRELVLRPHWLRLPMLLVFRTRAPTGLAGGLLDALLRVEGYTAAVQAGDDAAPKKKAREAGFERLPPEVRAVLRAGALVGAGFEVALVARLLEISPVDVLLRLQVARDFGVPLEDQGDGRIYLGLDADARARLLGGVLPSLANLWHRRIAELVSEAEAAEVEPEPEVEIEATPSPAPEPTQASADAPAEAIQAPAEDAGDGAMEAAAGLAGDFEPVPGAAGLAGVVDRVAQERAAEALAGARQAAGGARASDETKGQVKRERDTLVTPEREEDHDWQPGADEVAASDAGPGAPRQEEPRAARVQASAPAAHPTSAPHGRRAAPHVSRRHRRPRSQAPRSGDAARAASHLSAAGDREAAAERYLAAAQEAAGQLADSQALAHARQALALLDSLPASAKRRRLRVAALVEIAQVEWRSAGSRRGRTLEAAMATAEAARDALTGDDPAELRAQVALTIAGIGYDRGDLRSLEQALAALTAAARSLMAAGDPLGAASLLNDQAAIFIRLGDPVRALHLLDESRKVFEARGEDEPLATVELAETHHLYARVPLHAAVQPGRERDAILMGLDHALIAEKLYRKADEPRELGRVWETMGRLELARGKRERAAQRLTAALEIQQRIGDAIGLARTSAALADLLAADGQIEESLRLLAASIALNRAKGSHVGLAFNRQTLARLGPKIGAPGQGLAAVIERELAAAEKLLGSRPLPPGLEVGTAG